MQWTLTNMALKKEKKEKWVLNYSSRLSLRFHLLQYIDCFVLFLELVQSCADQRRRLWSLSRQQY